jgi:hypothetical protein
LHLREFSQFAQHKMSNTEGPYTICPICLDELAKNRQEVGALTFTGQRIEQELYHVGCVTMMLCHRGAINLKSINGPEPQISWGLSPVTRKTVDGFMQMPQLANRTKWIDFVDWRSTGQITVEELLALVSATLQIDQAALELLETKCQDICVNGSITVQQLENDILPCLKEASQQPGNQANSGSLIRASTGFTVKTAAKTETKAGDSDDAVPCLNCLPWRRSRK